MIAFANHFAFEFKTALRNPNLLLLDYLFPLGFYVAMGLVMTQINPIFVDTMLPAMVVFVILAGTILGLPNPLVEAREAGVFRAYKINGVPASSILAIPVIAAIFHALIGSAIVSVTATPLFNAAAPSNWWAFALITFVTAFTCASFGALIGVVSGSTRTTVLWSQLIFLPSMLLGGMMVPIAMLPTAALVVSGLLPPTYAMQAYQGLAFGAETVWNPTLALILLAAAGIMAFALAIFLFNWDSRNDSRRGHPALGLLALLPFVVGVLIVVANPPTAASTQSQSAPIQATAPAYWPTSEWRTSTPEEQGVDSAQLLQMLQHVDEAGINLRSMTVIRNGYIVLEAYYQPFTADRKYPVYSVTKSVVGALTGVAIDEGYITDTNQPVLSFFPERKIANRTGDKEALTIHDLLTMRPGLDCADEKIGAVLDQDKDWVQYTLDLPMASPPGEQLVYCTAGIHLLSAILGRATLTNTAAYAQSRLFAPLGISPDEVVWPSDPQGVTLGGYGIEMRPHDMAKLGLLYLYGGKWSGKQIVPAEWAAASATTQATGDKNKNYGYTFWVYPTHFAAEGLGEQKIMVVKDRNLVVVTTSAIDWHKSAPIEKLLQDYIIPAAKSERPLPANPDAFEQLQDKVKFLAEPRQPVPSLAEAAQRISGKTYIPEANPNGWKAITFRFEEGSPEAHVVVQSAGDDTSSNTSSDTSLAIGLDNVYRPTQIGGSTTWLRGHWESDSTFVIRQLQWSPDLEETEFRIDFTGDNLKIHVQEMVFDHYNFDVEATARTR